MARGQEAVVGVDEEGGSGGEEDVAVLVLVSWRGKGREGGGGGGYPYSEGRVTRVVTILTVVWGLRFKV